MEISRAIRNCMGYIVLTIVYFFFVISCKKELKENSATRLLKTRNTERIVKNSDSLNVDLINGFRSLELGTNIDSLDFNGWINHNLNEDINFKRKNMVISIDNKNYDCEVGLTFFEKKLQIIVLNFMAVYDSPKSKYVPVDLFDDYIHKPKLLSPFEYTFDEMKWAKLPEYKYLGNIEDIILDDLFNEDFLLFNKSRKENFLDENVKNFYHYAPGKGTSPNSGIFIGSREKEYLYENIGSRNGIKILLKNNLVKYAKKQGYYKRGSIISYRDSALWFDNSDITVIFFRIENFRKYWRFKNYEDEDQVNKDRIEREKKDRKKDSLLRLQKISEI